MTEMARFVRSCYPAVCSSLSLSLSLSYVPLADWICRVAEAFLSLTDLHFLRDGMGHTSPTRTCRPVPAPLLYGIRGGGTQRDLQQSILVETFSTIFSGRSCSVTPGEGFCLRQGCGDLGQLMLSITLHCIWESKGCTNGRGRSF